MYVTTPLSSAIWRGIDASTTIDDSSCCWGAANSPKSSANKLEFATACTCTSGIDTSTSYVTSAKDTQCFIPSDKRVDSPSGISSPRLHPKSKSADEVSFEAGATEFFAWCCSHSAHLHLRRIAPLTSRRYNCRPIPTSLLSIEVPVTVPPLRIWWHPVYIPQYRWGGHSGSTCASSNIQRLLQLASLGPVLADNSMQEQLTWVMPSFLPVVAYSSTPEQLTWVMPSFLPVVAYSSTPELLRRAVASFLHPASLRAIHK